VHSNQLIIVACAELQVNSSAGMLLKVWLLSSKTTLSLLFFRKWKVVSGMLIVFQEAVQRDTLLRYARLNLAKSVLQVKRFVWQRNAAVYVFICTNVTADVIATTMATSVSTSIVSMHFTASNNKSKHNH